MDKVIDNNLGLIGHKLGDRLTIIRQLFENKELEKQELNKEDIEIIKSSKYLFQEFLNELITKKRKLKLPENFNNKIFKELLKNSNFDWTKKKLFDNYANFYIELMMSLVKKL